jgi:hypothetical protein
VTTKICCWQKKTDQCPEISQRDSSPLCRKIFPGALASPASTTKRFLRLDPAAFRRHRPALSPAGRRAHREPSCAGATARWRAPARFCCAHYLSGLTAQIVPRQPSTHAPSTPAPQPTPHRAPVAPLVTIGRPSWRPGPPEHRSVADPGHFGFESKSNRM